MKYYHQDDPDTHYTWEQMVSMAGTEDQVLVDQYIRNNGYKPFTEGDTVSSEVEGLTDDLFEEAKQEDSTYDEFEAALNIKPPVDPYAEVDYTTHAPISTDPASEVNITDATLPSVFAQTIQDFATRNNIDLGEGGASRGFIPKTYDMFDIIGMMERKGTPKEISAAKYLSKILNLETVDPENPLSILSQEEEGVETILETSFGGIEVVQTDDFGDQLAIFVNGKDDPYMLDLSSNTFDAWKENLKVISTIQETESILTGDALKNSWAGGFVRNLMDLGKRDEGYSLSEVNNGLEYAGYRITDGSGRGYSNYTHTPVLEKKNSEGEWEVVFTPDLTNVKRGRITGEPLVYTDENLLVSPTQTGYQQISTFLENNIDPKGRDKLLQWAFDIAVVNNNKAEKIRLEQIKPNISPKEAEKEIFALPVKYSHEQGTDIMGPGISAVDWENKNLGIYWETLRQQVNTLRKQDLISDTQVEAFYSWMAKNLEDSMKDRQRSFTESMGKETPNVYQNDTPKNVVANDEVINRFKSLGGLENEPGNIFEFVNDKGELKTVNLKTLLMTPMLQGGGDIPSFFEGVNYDSGVETDSFLGPMMAPNNFVKVLYNQVGARLLDQKSSGPVGLLFKSNEETALLELGTAMIRKKVQVSERNMEIIQNMLPALAKRGNEIYKGGIKKLEELLEGIDAPADYQFIVSGDDYFVQVSTGPLDKPLSEKDQKRYNQATQVANELTMLVNDMQVSQKQIEAAYRTVGEKQGKYLKETGYTEQLGLVSSLEYGTGDLVGQDFASGFNSLWLTTAGIFNRDYALREQRKENFLTQYVFQPQADFSGLRGVKGGGFFEGVELEDGKVYREGGLNTFRFGAQQAANTTLALATGGLGRAWAIGSSLNFGMQGVNIATRAAIAVPFGISSYGDTWRNLNIQQDMVEIAKSNQINLDRAWNDGDIDSSFSYSRQTAQNNLLIAQSELSPLQIHAASASNATIEAAFTYLIGTGRNTVAFYDDIASFNKLRSSLKSTKIRQILEQSGATHYKTFGQLPLAVQAKIVGLYGKEWIKRQGREILEEEAIEFNQQVVTQGLILANPIDFSRMDDVAFSTFVSSGPMNTTGVITNAFNTVGRTIKNTEVINSANNKIDGWLGELDNLHGNNKKRRSEIYMLINEQFKMIGFENFKMTAQTLALGKDKIYELMQLNEMKVGLWSAAGVTPGMNQKQINDQISKYKKGLKKSELELFEKEMSNVEGSIAEIQKDINWEAAKSNLGSTWTYYNKNLNDNDNVYKGLKNDQERIAYILQTQRQDQIDYNTEKAKANATDKQKQEITNRINAWADDKKASGVWGRVSKKRLQELEDQIWANKGLNQYLYQGKALTASIRTNADASRLLGKTSLNYIQIKDSIEKELNKPQYKHISPQDKKQIIDEYNKEKGYGALIDLADGRKVFLVENEKEARAAIDNNKVPAGTVLYHEYRHAVDRLYFDNDPSKINDYAERLFASIWNHNRQDESSAISLAGAQAVGWFLGTGYGTEQDQAFISMLFNLRSVNEEGSLWNEDGTLTDEGRKGWNAISDTAKDELAKRIEESIYANLEYVKNLVKTPGAFGRGKIFIEEAILGKAFGKMLVNTNDKALDFAISNALAFERGETSLRERARGIELEDIGKPSDKKSPKSSKPAKRSGKISGEAQRAKAIVDALGSPYNAEDNSGFNPEDRKWGEKLATQLLEMVKAYVEDYKNYGSHPIDVKEELTYGAIAGLYRDGKDGKNDISRFNTSNDSLYGYLMGRIKWRVDDIWDAQFKNKLKTVDLDQARGKIDQPEKTESKPKPKSPTKPKVEKEIDAFFDDLKISGKPLADNQAYINKTVRAIESTLRTKLEGIEPGSKEYRKIVRDEISKATAFDIENLMFYGTRDSQKIKELIKGLNKKEIAALKYKNAINFIKENAEVIVDKLDITTINYSYPFLSEKLRDKDNKILRYSGPESRQYNDDVDKGYIKGQKIKDIYAGNAKTVKKNINPKLLKQWMNYFTDPSIEENTRDARLVSLAKIISEELGQDLVPTVIRSVNPKALIEAEISAIERSMGRTKFSAKILGPKLYNEWIDKYDSFAAGLYSLHAQDKLSLNNIEKLHRSIYSDESYNDYHKKVAKYFSATLKPFTKITDKALFSEEVFLQYAQDLILNQDTNEVIVDYAGSKLSASQLFNPATNSGMIDVTRQTLASNAKKRYDDAKTREAKDEIIQQDWAFANLSYNSSGAVGKGWKKENGKWVSTKRTKETKDFFSGKRDFDDNFMKKAFDDIKEVSGNTITFKDDRVIKRKYVNPKSSVVVQKKNIIDLEGDDKATKELREAAWNWTINEVKNLKTLSADERAMILTALNDGVGTALRIAAPLYGHASILPHKKWDKSGGKFIVLKKDKDGNQEYERKDGEFVLDDNGKKIPLYENAYRWEHSIPARLVLYYMYDNIVNENKLISLEKLKEDYRVTIIPIEMDDVITKVGFSKAALANYIPGVQPWWKRMYNTFTMGRIPYAIKAYNESLDGLSWFDKMLQREFDKNPHTAHLRAKEWFWKRDPKKVIHGRMYFPRRVYENPKIAALYEKREKVVELMDNFGIKALQDKWKKAKGENKENIELALQEWFKKVPLHHFHNIYTREELAITGQKWEDYYNEKKGTVLKIDAQEQNTKNAIADKAMRNARNPKWSKKIKGISVLDFDDTIAISNSKVIVYLPQKLEGVRSLENQWMDNKISTTKEVFERREKIEELERDNTVNELRNKLKTAKGKAKENIKLALEEKFKIFGESTTAVKDSGIDIYTGKPISKPSLELTPADFAKRHAELESMGAIFDFSQFNKVIGGKKGPLFNKLQKAVNKFGNKNVFILTARPQASAVAIQRFLKELGIELKIENIVGLEDGKPEAKADWIVSKAAEGYNDFYFADDQITNVKAVKDVLNVLDVKSKVQQARAKFSGKLSKDFNKMIERHKGIGADKTYSAIKAKLDGRRPWHDITNPIIPPSADDFRGLTQYTFAGKGKQGEADQAFFNKALIRPYTRGIAALEQSKYNISNSYQALKKANPIVADLLNKTIPGTIFRWEDAIRVSLWIKSGVDLTQFGLSKRDAIMLNKLVKNDPQLNAFAEGLLVVTKKPSYVPPREGWQGSSIIQDLNILSNDINRKEFLSEFIENVNIIFSKDNLHKVEAIYGTPVRVALEDSIYRMINGTNRSSGNNALTNKWLTWLNNAVGSIMFLNRRSALLQLVSIPNFINWSDNSIFKAALAFANQPQYWKDVVKIFFSPKLKLRRSGLKGDVNEAEIASTVAKADNKVEVFISIMLKYGFVLNQITDSLAIALGGATYYRNRLNTYVKQGMDPDQADKKAWSDFSDISDEVQQSADPLLVSREQASNLGRLVLAFQNVTMQMVRKSKKAGLDLIHGRGNPFTNLSRLVYYTFVQNLIFSTLQQALFAVLPGFSDDDEEERAADYDKRTTKILNNMLDTVLRGSGLRGAIISTIKNIIIEYNKQESQPRWKRDHTYTLIQALNLSPPIGSKARKFYGAIQTNTIFEKDVIAERGFDVMIDGKFQLSPSYNVLGSITSAAFNIPLDRLVDEINGITESLDARNTAYQRIALALGWRSWDVNASIEEHDLIKATAKEKRKKEGIEKGKKTRAENKKKAQEEKIEAWNKLSKAEQDSIKINREIRIQNAFDEMMKKMSEINY